MRTLMLLILMALLLSCCTEQQTYRVKSVHDGDTFYLENGEAIRLSDIDAPEIGQTYGEESKQFLILLLKDNPVSIERVGTSYGRSVCKVWADDVYINKILVQRGYAWAYSNSPLHRFQEDAKEDHLGLWYLPHEPPFIYRKRNKH